MLYVSSSKTLTFKNVSHKTVSQGTKDVKETPSRKSNKSMQMKRGSNDNKENICHNADKVPTKEFEPNSPAKDIKKQGLFGLRGLKGTLRDDHRGSLTPSIEQKPYNSLVRPKNGDTNKVKIHLKDSVETKSSYENKRRHSAQPLTQNSLAEYMCANHPEKKAKYQLKIEEETFYCCSKCAISLAAKGHKVKEILSKQPSDRSEILQAFLDKIQQLTPKMRQMISELQRMRLSVSACYEREYDKHNNYYDSIMNMFASMKREGECFLKESKEKSLKELNMLETAIKEHLDDTLFMQQDVIPNINHIMSSTMSKVNEDKFSSIMNVYNQELNNFQNRIADLSAYRAPLPALESGIAQKLQSCLESIPLFRLEIKLDDADTSRHDTLDAIDRSANHMYFSFECPLRSGEKTSSKSKSKSKESGRKQLAEGGLLRQLANSNSKKPFVSLFSEQPVHEGSSSPSFKAI